jgi:hypothetical protein
LTALAPTRVDTFRAFDLDYELVASRNKLDALLDLGRAATCDPEHGERR